MPHFLLGGDATVLGEVPDLHMAIQDAISCILDCPMVRVTYSHMISGGEVPGEVDFLVTVSAAPHYWDRQEDSRDCVKDAINDIFDLIGCKCVTKTVNSFNAAYPYR